jgi:hypothetical protein
VSTIWRITRFTLERSLAALWFALFVLSVLPAIATAQVPCRYEITDIIRGPMIFGDYVPISANRLSQNGRYVCGQYSTFGGYHGFVYDAVTHHFTALPHPVGVANSAANGVNDSGVVVGHYDNIGFVFDSVAGVYTTTLTSISAQGTCELMDINNAGKACGYRSIGSPRDPINPYQAFTWTAQAGIHDLGIMIDPGSVPLEISESGIVVGFAGLPATDQTRGFTSSETNIQIVPPVLDCFSSLVSCVNEQAMIAIIGLFAAPDQTKAFVSQRGVYRDILPLPGYYKPFVKALASNGLAVGSCSLIGFPGTTRAAVWQGSVTRDLTAIVNYSQPMDSYGRRRDLYRWPHSSASKFQ